ncbi:MAG: polysaccharide biosynthesis tyrosine autokinase [Deltaproteobacteria bacterium]|nr:polysaccharide biosynthesis tyrosine autokinase [Deltaproteobacteria bacterium]
MQNQDNQEIHLMDYWHILVKRRKVFLAFFLSTVICVATYSFLVTPIYKGTAQILFELNSNPTMSFVEGEGGLLQMKDSREYFNTQAGILKSRAFADRVVRSLELNDSLYFVSAKESKEGGVISSVLSVIKSFLFGDNEVETLDFPEAFLQNELDPKLTDLVLLSTEVSFGRKSNILDISFSANSPVVAAGMANGIANAYIEHNLDIRVRPFKDAVDWLTAKRSVLRSKVEDSERSLQQYKEGEGIVSFEARENVILQELKELTSQQVRVEAKSQDAEIRYRQIKAVIDKPELLVTVPDIMNNLVIQGIRSSELNLKAKISELSEKYGPKHPQMLKARSELEMVQFNLTSETRKMLNAAKTEYIIAKTREDSLRKKVDDQKDLVLELSRKAIEFNVVSGESISNKRFYTILLGKLQEAQLSSGINVSNAQVVDYSIVPKSPVSPRRGFNILLGILVGLMLGGGAAFFVEYMDKSLKNEEDVESYLGLPFLGYIPFVANDGTLDGSIFSDTRSLIAEAYRTLRTSIMFSSIDEPPKVMLVTSAVPGEGKTTTATNLAFSMAKMGEKVVLIDADLRHMKVHDSLGLENKNGLTDIIMGTIETSTALKDLPDTNNLSVITAGTHSPNPAELLSSEKMSMIISELKERFDRIIFDSPPVLAVSDSLTIARKTDGVLFVVNGGTTSRELVSSALRHLVSAKIKTIGVTLNKISMSKSPGYGYYHHYYPYGGKDSTEVAGG